MAHGRSKTLLNGEALPRVRPLKTVPATAEPSERETETLRATVEHQARELAALKEREAQAERLAHRDDLTGLYNRRRMRELLDLAIADAARHGRRVGLLFIDLNGFKSINDEHGHAAGDAILSSVAMRIAGRVRGGDIVCRFGGDEFVVVLPNVPDAAAVAQVADAIRERVALPYWIDANEHHLTAAIGESMYPHDGESADVLLHHADETMYRLKTRLARPMVSLGTMPQPQHSRRRGDRLADPGEDIPGGDP
jgi:diguanylate cyclase (GGDEF)-like protein